MPDTASVPADGSASAPRVDKLEVIQELPRGSVGSVRKAKNARTERLVALRQFEAPQWLDDIQELLDRIMAAAKAASMLQHPNIATLYTCGYKNFTIFMTSEFVDGPTLREVAAGRQLSLPEILAVAKQLAAGLDYAHAHGVVHNNLNLCNLKLLPDGSLKILDFGLLKHRHLLSQTPAKKLENEPYLSPEEVKTKPITKSANLFTAATILYELLTTRSPFAGQHLGEVDKNITEVTPHALHIAHARVPEVVSRVILKGLAKDPAERFQSGKEMVEALDNAMQGVPMRSAAPASAGAKAITSEFAGQTVKITVPPGLAGPAPAVRSTAVTTATRAAAPAGTTTTATRAAASAKPAAKQPYWIYAAGGVVLLALIGGGILFALRPKPDAQPPVERGPGDPALTIQPVDVPPPPTETQPALDVHEVAGSKTGKPVKNAKGVASTPVPVTPAGPTVGELEVSTTPAGALVQVEGPTGQTWRISQSANSLAPGTYKVTVSMAGYASDTRTLTVTAGNRAQAEIHLTALKGFLTVASNPAGGRVWIDGKDAGKVSPAEFMLDPAVHDVVVRQEGYLDAQSSIKVVAGQSVNFAPAMRVAGRTDNIKTVGGMSKMFGGAQSGMARIEIRTTPKGAQILINGSPFGKTTPVDIQVEPGNYEITLTKDGYKPVHKSLTVGQSEKFRIEETLPQ